MKILAVDDDEIILELLVGTLKSVGHSDIWIANSGEEALQILAAERTPFDCFLLDIQMPGMDGIELCGRIRSIASYKSSPIIMVTSMSGRSFVDNAFAAGATDYVTKPFEKLELCTRVNLAEKLVQEKRIAQDSRFEALAFQAKFEDANRFGLEVPVTIEDVPHSVDHLALENYLLQLSRSKIYQSVAVAFRIHDVEHVYSKSSPSEFYYTLMDVADAITTVLKRSHYLIAYYGRGTFVCVTHRQNTAINEDLGQLVQAEIDSMELCYDNGERCVIGIDAGPAATTSLLSAGNPASLVQTAIALLDESCSTTPSNAFSKRGISAWMNLRNAG